MKLILGNITFLDPQIDGEHKAIVHEVYGVIDCSQADICGDKTAEDIAHEIGEDLCNLFLAYIIPQVYKGEIEYECLAKCSFDVSELNQENND